MRYLFSFFLLFSIFALSAQTFSSEVFHEGFLVTTERDTIKGDLKYNLETNSLTMIKLGKVKAFSSHKIFYFEIFDQILNNYRRFYSVPFTVSIGYKIPVFFELIYEGKLSLISREQIVSQTVNSSINRSGGSNTRLVIKYLFYFMDSEGKINYFSGKKKDLWILMSKKQKAIKQFIKDNRLSTNTMADLVRITAFFNSI